MKVSGIWVLYIVAGSALIILNFSVSDVIITGSTGSKRITNRKLKEHVKLEDYGAIDPVPSSKASIEPGPIEHGTPLNPFIPDPAPPSPGQHI